MNKNCTYSTEFTENIDILRPNNENFKFPSQDSLIKKIKYFYSSKNRNIQLGSFTDFINNAK
jgi:hypothetical protein